MIKTAFCLLIGQNGPTAYSNWCFHAITNTEVKFIDNFLVLICNIWDGWQQKTRIQVSFCAILYFWNWHQLSWSQSHYLRHFLLLKLALISNIRQFRDCLFSSNTKNVRSYGTFTFGLIWTCCCYWYKLGVSLTGHWTNKQTVWCWSLINALTELAPWLSFSISLMAFSPSFILPILFFSADARASLK